MNPLDKQPGGQKVETGAQSVQGSEKQETGAELRNKQAQENTEAGKKHQEGRVDAAKTAAEARANLLVDSPTPTSDNPPQPENTQSTTDGEKKGDWTDSFKGFGEKISTFLGGLFSSVKSSFSKISTMFSSWGKKKEEKGDTEKTSDTKVEAKTSDKLDAPTNDSSWSGEISMPTPIEKRKKERGRGGFGEPKPEFLKGSPPPGADPTWGLGRQELLKHPTFLEKAGEVARRIGITPKCLLICIRSESGGKTWVQNKNTNCTGLIQFHPSYSKPHTGYYVEEIRRMTGLQQLVLIDRYFKRYRGKVSSDSEFYRLIFYPASKGKPANYVFGSQKKKKGGKSFAEKVRDQNSGISKLSQRPDGLVDNACFERYCQKIGLTTDSSYIA